MTPKICIHANLYAALLVSALLPAAVVARTVDLVNPEPVTINCSLSPQKMQQAIEAGGSVRNWKVIGKRPGNAQGQTTPPGSTLKKLAKHPGCHGDHDQKNAEPQNPAAVIFDAHAE